MATVTLTQYDTQPPLRVKLKDARRRPIPLGSQDHIYFDMVPRGNQAPGGPTLANRPCVVNDLAHADVQYEWADGDTDVPGVYDALFRIVFADGSVESVPNDETITVVIQPTVGPEP